MSENKEKKVTRLEYEMWDGVMIGLPVVNEDWEINRLKQTIMDIERERQEGQDNDPLREGGPG